MATAAQNVARAPIREWATGPKEVEVVRGNSYLLTNVIRNLTCLQEKVLYWNLSVGSGNVSTETLMKTVNFLEENNLHEVAVQSDDYSPLWYAGRVFSNPNTSLLTKVLCGPGAVITNFLGLGKLLVSDNYDFLSNSITINSDNPDLALYEAGRAKEYNKCNYPTLYAMTPAFVTVLATPIFGALTALKMNSDAIGSVTENIVGKQTSPENRHTYTTMASKAYVPTVAATFGMLMALPKLIQALRAPNWQIANLLGEAQDTFGNSFWGAVIGTHILIRLQAAAAFPDRK